MSLLSLHKNPHISYWKLKCDKLELKRKPKGVLSVGKTQKGYSKKNRSILDEYDKSIK